MTPGQPHLDFTEAMLQSRTVVIVFLIVLAMLICFVGAYELGQMWRGSMARYRLHNIASGIKERRDARACSRRIDRHLRSCGFVEVAPDKWQKPIEPGAGSQSPASPASASKPAPGPDADAFIFREKTT